MVSQIQHELSLLSPGNGEVSFNRMKWLRPQPVGWSLKFPSPLHPDRPPSQSRSRVYLPGYKAPRG
jgi:hypothetical protein